MSKTINNNFRYILNRSNVGREVLPNDLFLVDQITGTVQTNQTYGRFGDGHFTLYVMASNQDRKRSPKVGPGFDSNSIPGDIARLKVQLYKRKWTGYLYYSTLDAIDRILLFSFADQCFTRHGPNAFCV